MKIIKPGNAANNTQISDYRFICQKCGCVFECDKSEVKMTYVKSRKHITCPCPSYKCDNEVVGEKYLFESKYFNHNETAKINVRIISSE